MKRVIYVAVAVFALGIVSCSKQDIQPNSNSDTAVPTWKSFDRDGELLNGEEGLPPTGGGSVNDPGAITDPNNDPDPGGETITDPNNDPDPGGTKQ